MTTEIGWAVAFARAAGGAGDAGEAGDAGDAGEVGDAAGYAGPVVLRGAPAGGARWMETPSGAEVAVVGDVVVKLHHPRTDPGELWQRLAAVRTDALAKLFVRPLTDPRQAPDGRWATAWPKVEVLSEDDVSVPWTEAGRLLAELHRATPPTGLPPNGGPARVERALRRASAADHPRAPGLPELGMRLLHELASSANRHTPGGAAAGQTAAVHGDWHLGQLAISGPRLRLLDVDDLGLGDPAWDLGRPAGFWAAGLLDDAPWRAFLDGYREARGPAVPATGDPWPSLDLAARCAVFVAAVRAVSVQPAHSTDPADSLLAACARM
jgi:hypothetical protein